MPYKVQKIKLPPELDRRRKLTEKQRQEIVAKYSTGEYSMRSLAKSYNVNKDTILRIVNPISADLHNLRNRNSYHNADKHRNTKDSYKKCIAYKQELLNHGVLKLKGDNDND